MARMSGSLPNVEQLVAEHLDNQRVVDRVLKYRADYIRKRSDLFLYAANSGWVYVGAHSLSALSALKARLMLQGKWLV